MLIAVILGNRMNDDGTISVIMVRRLELALRVDKAFAPDKFILSGGIANKKANIAEADKMYEYLLARGVQKDRLVKEDKSLSTKENAKFSVEIAKSLGATELLVCTTNEHMSRSYLNPIKLFSDAISDCGIKLSSFSE